MARYPFAAERSRLRVRGRTSLHPIRAAADRVEGWIELEDGAPRGAHLRVDTARLRTGNPLFDREIDRRLEVDDHPEITGDLQHAAPNGEPGSFRLSGTLTVHGVSREVDGDVLVDIDGERVRITGEQRFTLRDFAIEPPELLMFRVAPTVLVQVELEAPT